MEFVPNTRNDIDSWKEVQLVYNSALKEIGTKLEILNDEFQHVHQYNPIEHIKSRIKSPESIVKKLKKHGYESSIQNMVKYVNDIAGIRVICSFTSDIYRIAEMLINQNDIRVLSVKDYILNPKPSGYKSYHLIVTVPIFLSDRIVDAKVEIQIRKRRRLRQRQSKQQNRLYKEKILPDGGIFFNGDIPLEAPIQ